MTVYDIYHKMQKLLILLSMAVEICFASPFNLVDKDEEEVFHSKHIQSQIVEEGQIFEDDVIHAESHNIKSFIETNQAKFILIDIQNGHKDELTIAVGDSIRIEDIDIQLQSCSLEKDDFYHKISTAECLCDGQYMTISNDCNIGNIHIIKNKLLIVDCYHK